MSLLKPSQAFVDNPSHVGDPALQSNHLANHIADLFLIDTTLPIVDVFTLTRGSDPTTAISTIITASDNDVVQDIYILVSSTQTTKPTSLEIKVAGAKIPGTSASYNVTGLSATTTYYGWAMAVDGTGNESVIVASTPTSLQTSSNFVTSLANMVEGQFGGIGVTTTPFAGLKDLPSFLVGVPMTKGINSYAYACAFDNGPIHAYGFRASSGWGGLEADTEIIYSGSKYDGAGDWVIDQVVYKYFPSPTFNISTFSYIWFFTKTPRDEGVAALNGP